MLFCRWAGSCRWASVAGCLVGPPAELVRLGVLRVGRSMGPSCLKQLLIPGALRLPMSHHHRAAPHTPASECTHTAQCISLMQQFAPWQHHQPLAIAPPPSAAAARCSAQCEARFALKCNGSAYRHALFKLERGVCVTCKLDCHDLVRRLQAIEKGSHRRVGAGRASYVGILQLGRADTSRVGLGRAAACERGGELGLVFTCPACGPRSPGPVGGFPWHKIV